MAKRCIACGVNKILAEYHVNNHRSDGHETRCKTCVKAGRKGTKTATLNSNVKTWVRDRTGMCGARRV